MSYDIELSEITFLPQQLEIQVKNDKKHFLYTHIKKMTFIKGGFVKPLSLLIEFVDNNSENIILFVRSETIKNPTSPSVQNFTTLCENLMRKTKLDISYEIYPKFITYIAKAIFIFLCFKLIVIGWNWGLFEVMKGPMLVFVPLYGIYYLYGTIDKRIYGEQLISENQTDELEFYITYRSEEC